MNKALTIPRNDWQVSIKRYIIKLYLPVSIILFAIAPITVQGQYIPMAEEGKFWIYLNYYLSGDSYLPVSGHAKTFQGDTVFNSVNYKKMYRYNLKGYHNCPYPPCWQFNYPYETESKVLIALVREDTIEKQVFILPLAYGFCDTTEHLIFDFSLEVGDTLNTCIYEFIGADPEYPIPMGIVDSIGVRELFGRNRNTIYTTGIQTYHGDPPIGALLILEGFGLETYGIPINQISGLWDYCEDEGLFCELLLSTTAIEEDKQVNVFPNPTQGELTVTIGDPMLGATCTIVDAVGRVAQSFKLTELHSTAQLNAPGIYFWHIEQRGHLVRAGKIICH